MKKQIVWILIQRKNYSKKGKALISLLRHTFFFLVSRPKVSFFLSKMKQIFIIPCVPFVNKNKSLWKRKKRTVCNSWHLISEMRYLNRYIQMFCWYFDIMTVVSDGGDELQIWRTHKTYKHSKNTPFPEVSFELIVTTNAHNYCLWTSERTKCYFSRHCTDIPI